MSTEPTLLYTAHSSPLQLAFYNGSQFPELYRGGAFIVMRGSWNRNPPSGYEIARIEFDKVGKATRIEPFVTGWLVPQGEGKFAHMGRLAGCAVAKDGSLLVSDDKNGVIYRISYSK
jgi:glucose/arabinose dehydrogenase